jgi:broad specificity phosphatase PhoE
MPVERRGCLVDWGNLFLVRHGESTANEINRFAGAIDAPLTALGRAQAVRAARSWPDVLIDQVFVSPLSRARQTADIILGNKAAQERHLKVICDERISERHFGDFTLQNKTVLQRTVGLRAYESSLYGDSAHLHGGEEADMFHDRVLSFLRDELYPQLVAGKRVMVVAHKYVIELLSRLILRLPTVDGYDLRLPNAKILSGHQLSRYVHRESRLLNNLRDGIAAHHASVLLLSSLVGILLRFLDVSLGLPSIVPLGLLVLATTISLGGITLRGSSYVAWRDLLPVRRSVLRYALVPVVLAVSVLLVHAGDSTARHYGLAVALVFAAPTAITALTISRTSGGIVRPSIYMLLLSTLISAATIPGILALYGYGGGWVHVVSYLGLSTLTLLAPLLLVIGLRDLYPIATARFAERNAATAVLLLAGFVITAFQHIDVSTFMPAGLIAIAAGFAMRLVSVMLARHRRLYAIDDYVSMSYPNIFLIILLANVLGDPQIKAVATWYLLPMFSLVAFDELFHKRLLRHQPRPHLKAFLGIVDTR